MPKIEFVSYDGCFPNLCGGELVLKIDDEEVNFGKYCLCSGGDYGFESGFSGEYTIQAPYEDIDLRKFPQYEKYKKEILEVVNANVPWGCCGGCL